MQAIETRPLCLHIYRTGCIWADDKIVRADDRRTPSYVVHLRNDLNRFQGTRFVANWEFTLHVGGPNGVVICHAKSSYLGPPSLLGTNPGPISITIGSEGHTVQFHRGSSSSYGIYSFTGLDDKEYRWKLISRLCRNKMEWQCLNSQDQVVATYRVILFAIFKDGELRIHQPAQSMADLLVATCLAIRTPDH